MKDFFIYGCKIVIFLVSTFAQADIERNLTQLEDGNAQVSKKVGAGASRLQKGVELDGVGVEGSKARRSIFGSLLCRRTETGSRNRKPSFDQRRDGERESFEMQGPQIAPEEKETTSGLSLKSHREEVVELKEDLRGVEGKAEGRQVHRENLKTKYKFDKLTLVPIGPFGFGKDNRPIFFYTPAVMPPPIENGDTVREGKGAKVKTTEAPFIGRGYSISTWPSTPTEEASQSAPLVFPPCSSPLASTEGDVPSAVAVAAGLFRPSASIPLFEKNKQTLFDPPFVQDMMHLRHNPFPIPDPVEDKYKDLYNDYLKRVQMQSLPLYPRP